MREESPSGALERTRPDESYYVGHSDDLEKRFHEHGEGGKSAYSESRRPVELVWSPEFARREEARAAELQIKGWSRGKKEALISNDDDSPT
jgi:tRNA/rRNA methyltransferase